MDVETCPACGATGVPILYGMPDLDGLQALERGELVLGGCVIEPGLPTSACPACSHRWGSFA